MTRIVVSDTKVINLAGQQALADVDATIERTGAWEWDLGQPIIRRKREQNERQH